jgi:hypothetical protein
MMTHMGNQVTAAEAARIARRSRSQINRDAAAGRLKVAMQYPGYNGPRMFDEDVVREHYGIEQPEAVAS